MFLGCTIFSAGAATTYFTLNMGLPWVAFTYGFVSALGQGIALIPTMTIGMRWFPNQKGMAMGVVVGGFGGGAFIFNQIQTAILNPDNIAPDGEYFTNPELLARVPTLMLILAGIYISIQLLACCLVTEPAINTELVPQSEEMEEERNKEILMDQTDGESYVTPREALKRKELYLLWMTRFSVVMITQSVSGFYKAFGQSFIADDHFLSFVGAVSSVFNCSGRLFYGVLMDKTNYKTAMTVETVCLTLLVASLPATTYGGKIAFTIWIWAIYSTFPGTYSTQPAVTTQVGIIIKVFSSTVHFRHLGTNMEGLSMDFCSPAISSITCWSGHSVALFLITEDGLASSSVFLDLASLPSSSPASSQQLPVQAPGHTGQKLRLL